MVIDMGFMFALIIGLVFGFGLAYYLVGTAVNKSNNKGDSKGTIHHFSKQALQMKASEDNVHRDFPLLQIK